MELTVADVTRLFGVSAGTVIRWVQDGNLPTSEVNSQYRFNREELLEWAAIHKLAIPPAILPLVGGEQVAGPGLADALTYGGVAYRVAGGDRQELLANALQGLPLPAHVDREALLELFLARERLGTTTVGDGIAIPHPRCPLVLSLPRSAVRLCFLTQSHDFGAADGKPVDTLFLMVCRTVHEHLRLLRAWPPCYGAMVFVRCCRSVRRQPRSSPPCSGRKQRFHEPITAGTWDPGRWRAACCTPRSVSPLGECRWSDCGGGGRNSRSCAGPECAGFREIDPGTLVGLECAFWFSERGPRSAVRLVCRSHIGLGCFGSHLWCGVPAPLRHPQVAGASLVVFQFADRGDGSCRDGRNGVLFLLAWEAMALASYFLVTFEDELSDVRDAGRIYLIASHLGTAFLLLFFALFATWAGSLDFSVLAKARMSPQWSDSIAGTLFVLALMGFGTKAGFVPLHVWLPEAHPAAPSHVSAVMSGVMIKTGIYGLLRALTFLGTPPPWWGWLLFAIGLSSGVLGVLFALAQHNLKRLLAYHSVENIGIIALGLGTGLLGLSVGSLELAVLGVGGALLHVMNHAIFKGLLFLARVPCCTAQELCNWISWVAS